MSTDRKNIDKFFHHDLAGASEQPPLHIWENIEAALDKDKQKRVTGFTRARRYYSVAAMILLMTAAGTLFWLNKKPDEEKTNTKGNTAALVKSPMVNNLVTNQNNKASSSETIVADKADAVAALSEMAPASVSPGKIKQVNSVLAEAIKDESKTAPKTIASPESIMQATTVGENMHVMPTAQTIDIETTRPRIVNAPSALPFGIASIGTISSAPLVKIKRPGRWSVTAFFAPDITTRNLEQNFYSTLDEKKEEIIRTEKNGQLDFTVGARLEYRIDKHWSVQSGLSFSTNTIDIAQKMTFARFDKDGALKFRFNLSTGYAFMKGKSLPAPRFLGDSALALSSSSVLHYVNVPLIFKYNFAKGRFNFSSQAGIVARFITRESIDAVYSNNGANEKAIANEIQGLKRTYMNGVVGLGVDYAISKKVALTLFPSFNFATSSINRDAPVKAYPNTLSIASGVRMSL